MDVLESPDFPLIVSPIWVMSIPSTSLVPSGSSKSSMNDLSGFGEAYNWVISSSAPLFLGSSCIDSMVFDSSTASFASIDILFTPDTGE